MNRYLYRISHKVSISNTMNLLEVLLLFISLESRYTYLVENFVFKDTDYRLFNIILYTII